MKLRAKERENRTPSSRGLRFLDNLADSSGRLQSAGVGSILNFVCKAV